MASPRANGTLRDDIWSYVVARKPLHRPAGTLASRVTSVDIKLAYSRSTDQFVTFVLPDCNANPEGIPTVHNTYCESNLTQQAAKCYLGNQSQDNIVVWLPPDVWDDTSGDWVASDSWLTEDRRKLTAALSDMNSVSNLYRASTADSICVADETLTYCGPDTDRPVPVDSYVNLNDTGRELYQALEGDVSQFARGANAPTAVWTPSLVPTGKVGLARSLTDLVDGLDSVLVPRFRKVPTVTSVIEFQRQLESPVVLKDPFGTWGTGVVGITPNEDVVAQIRERERAVAAHRDWTDFSLLSSDDETFAFSSRNQPVSYGIAEEALTGQVSRGPHQYEIVSVPPEIHPLDRRAPIDFVTLAFAEPDGTVSTPSTMVRMTGTRSLNGNPRSHNMTDAGITQALNTELEVPYTEQDTFSFNLERYLEELAGRHVSEAEIEATLADAATVALAARNLSAFRAEHQISTKNTIVTNHS
ncbi:hypothetical protein [Halobellus inordinatus]|uniref:hypothetical protein n=1 Tax=Halobellus inordinatus TaxID=1126236 RepID=UPI00211485C3|nr:hypothetical protein [Halobellus ramosii]